MEKEKLSPLEVEVLLHYWYSAEDHPMLHGPLRLAFCERMVEAGIFSRGKDGVRYVGNSDALKPYIEAILSVPLPVRAWIIPSDF